jgi:type VI secretion system protein ImpH
MATESGIDGTAVAPSALERRLREDPTAFEFFQAVYLLEEMLPERERVGGFVDPAREAVRFGVPQSIAFPASELQTLEMDPDDAARMTVNFMGLTGPHGVLPLYYTLLAAERVRARDGAMRDFLDIFHHRIISLFYRAWAKYRVAATYDGTDRDALTLHLMDLIGFGAAGLRGRLPIRDESLLFYSGLLSLRSRPAKALEQMLADYFDVPVVIEQFVGAWYPLTESAQCGIGEETDASNQLGLGAVAGDEVWDQQSRVRIRLGPLTLHQYEDFLPGGSAYEPLRAFTRLFGRDELEFEIKLVLARDEVPGCTLGADDGEALPLGWCTWIRTTPFARDPDETTFTL